MNPPLGVRFKVPGGSTLLGGGGYPLQPFPLTKPYQMKAGEDVGAEELGEFYDESID